MARFRTARSYSDFITKSVVRFISDTRIIEQWWRRGVIIFVLILSAALAIRLQSRLPLLIVAMIMAGLAALFFLRLPSIAPLALIIAALIIPVSLSTGTQTTVNAAILLVAFLGGLWLFDMWVRKKYIAFVRSRTILPAFVLVIVAGLATIVGQLPWFAMAAQAPMMSQLGGLSLFAFSVMAFLLAANQIKELAWLKWLTWFFIGLGALYIVGKTVPSLRVIELFQSGATGSVFWIWLTALTFSQAFANRELPLKFRSLLIVLVLLILWLGWRNRGWASGWAPPFVAVLIILWLRSWKIGLLVTILASSAVILLKPDTLAQLVTANSYSIETRLIAWRIVLGEIAIINPVLGLGPANYYFYTPLFPILGYALNFNSHNQYVDLIAQTGIIGLITFLWFFGENVFLAWRLQRDSAAGFERAYAIGVLGGIAGMLFAGMLGDWLIPFVYNIGFNGFRASVLGWIFLGGLVALDQIIHGATITEARQP